MGGYIKVYGPAVSTAVSRVLACLLEKELDFKLLPIELSKRQHKTQDFLKLQPFGQVPAFQDDATAIFESRAISRYICDMYPDSGNTTLFSGNPAEKASIDQWVEAEAQSFNPPSSSLVFQLVFAPRMKLKQDTSAIKESEGKLKKVLDVYERRLGESRFLAGDEFSLADLCHLPNAGYIVEESDRAQLFTSRKNVGRWWEEISSRPSWKKVLEMRKSPTA
uniref:glutathione transferase n=1 Tax=Tulipa fosteriana TaxID=93697 RepID=A0A0H3U2E1_9LILI|nr:glutathione S-transferase [Tulipa fosteriana]